MHDDYFSLSEAPLDLAETLSKAQSVAAGAINLFLGATRAETHPRFGPLLALDYSAFAPMALRRMREIADAARGQWNIGAMVIAHRVGRCAVGETSVIIVASAPHRAEAFAACRYAIDTLKSSVPIWKKDIYTGGELWQRGTPLTAVEESAGASRRGVSPGPAGRRDLRDGS